MTMIKIIFSIIRLQYGYRMYNGDPKMKLYQRSHASHEALTYN